MRYDAIVVGSGWAGCICSRELAERGDKRVLVIEQRGHIGGISYDRYDDAGVLVHQYGPHIFHTSSERVFTYLSRFTEWHDFELRTVASLSGTMMVPVPFNLNTLHMVFDKDKATRLEEKLLTFYGMGAQVAVLDLRQSPDPEILDLAEYIYDNIFMRYTMKQWGKEPCEIDPRVTARVPIVLSRDDRYFHDRYQKMPSDGYTKLFEKILDHSNIEIRLKTGAEGILEVSPGRVTFEGQPFDGMVVFTGQIDELFGLRFGRLPYRTLDFVFETHDYDFHQPTAVVNYTVDQPWTRITEFKHMTRQVLPGRTTIVKEFSREYCGAGEIPFYSVTNPGSLALYQQYVALAREVPNLILVGRIAEFKYYNMDAVIERALEVMDAAMPHNDVMGNRKGRLGPC